MRRSTAKADGGIPDRNLSSLSTPTGWKGIKSGQTYPNFSVKRSRIIFKERFKEVGPPKNRQKVTKNLSIRLFRRRAASCQHLRCCRSGLPSADMLRLAASFDQVQYVQLGCWEQSLQQTWENRAASSDVKPKENFNLRKILD